MEISKVVIPAAGLGAKFLPFSKSIPREMLPILNKPAIQYIVEEALQSELSNFFVVTGRLKNVITDYFDIASDLESLLKEKNKESYLENTNKIIHASNFVFVRQPEPLGLGHAVYMARHSINKEYFAIALPDDIIMYRQPALSQLIRIARQEKTSVVAVQEVPAECIQNYGIVAIKKQITPNLFQLSSIIEKPHPKDAPSSLAVVGRYILSYKIFNSLEYISSYATEELQLTDAITHMIQRNERVFAYKIQGTRYDIGTPLGWIKSIIGNSLQDPNYASSIRKFLTEISTTESFIYNPAKTIENNI